MNRGEWQQVQRDIGASLAGALHQGAWRQPVCCTLFDGANFGDGIKWIHVRAVPVAGCDYG